MTSFQIPKQSPNEMDEDRGMILIFNVGFYRKGLEEKSSGVFEIINSGTFFTAKYIQKNFHSKPY